MLKRFFAIVFLLFTGASWLPAQTVTNTILNINYESGTTNSGITGVTATHATAPDAAYMVQPGATGNWAIAHKIAYGDSAYYSDASWRSEADAIAYLPARFQPGDERRYEFSILLKDWTPWVSGAIHETNIFQLKVSGNSETDSGVPLQLRVARNALRLRYVNSSKVYNFLADVRPYYNQWIHFRIDAKWTLDATGYIKTYMKLPGQSDFTMVDDSTGYNTFAGDPGIGNIGYIKWGLYGIQEGLTHTIYHDDVRILELNNASTPIGIHGNAINNPTGSSTVNFSSPIIGGTSDPNITSDGSTTPSFFYNNATTGPEASGLTATGFSGRVTVFGWTNRTSTAAPATPLNPNQYYEFKVGPAPGYKINFTNFSFTGRQGRTTDPSLYVMRSSLDNFSGDISAAKTFTTAANTDASFPTYDLSAMPDVTEPVTIRLYFYNNNSTSGNSAVGISNFQFSGNVFQSNTTLPVAFNGISARFSGNTLQVNWNTGSENNNSHFEIQASKDGQHFTTIKTTPSKNGNSSLPLHYEAIVAVTDMAAMISLPFVIGLLGWGMNRRRNKIILLSVLVVFTALAISCNKYNDALHSGPGKLFIRIKQVDTDGKASYSKVVTVVSDN